LSKILSDVSYALFIKASAKLDITIFKMCLLNVNCAVKPENQRLKICRMYIDFGTWVLQNFFYMGYYIFSGRKRFPAHMGAQYFSREQAFTLGVTSLSGEKRRIHEV